MDSVTLGKIEFDRVREILSRFCATHLGKAQALRITPSRNPEMIVRWLEQVTEMVDVLIEVGTVPFGGIVDITEPLRRAKPSGGATAEDFAQIATSLEGAGNVRAFLVKLPEKFARLGELAEELSAFDGEIRAIRDVVAPDGTVRDDASGRLLEIRRAVSRTQQEISDIMHRLVNNPGIAKYLQSTNLTLHGDRYVLPVKEENRGRVPGVVHRASNTGATVFVEPTASVELNNRLAELAEDERREIERLLHELSLRVQGRSDEMARTMRMIAHLDVISAKAQYSYQFEMTCPALAERGELEFARARHPLLVDQAHQQSREGVPEANRHPVVPIDVRLGGAFDILVITGSNTGGKTVAMKTVALLAAMAQSGMHIPARRGAKLPIFRDIFFDVGDEQSLQQSLSTFGGHVQRLRYILGKADKTSLVLLDELGSGTDPEEGAAIGQAVLDELQRIGCLAMVTTHLSMLKAYAYNHERVDNASVEFDTETLSPTYELLIGTPGESHAITVAKKLGLPKRITGSATRYLARQGKQFRKAIQATSAARQSAEAARAEAQEAQLQAQSQQEAYQAKLDDLNRLRQEFATWLARLPELKPGDRVHVPQMRRQGVLVRMELHRQIALVEVDGKQVEVPLEDLMPDLGQNEIRREINQLRRQIAEQARQSEQAAEEAQRIRKEYHLAMEHHRQRARQFDTWLSALGRVKVGDEVPIARKPGRGTIKSMDLPGLRATVETAEGELEISIQEIFPQEGPYSAGRGAAAGVGKRRKSRKGGKTGPSGKDEEADKDRPIDHKQRKGKSAQRHRQAVLSLEAGAEVFVIPFKKRASLVRVDAEKGKAVVQSGAFEMQVALDDLEPVGPEGPARGKANRAKN